MAYTRKYHTIAPVEPGSDMNIFRWLVRETFERKATGDMLKIIEYDEKKVDANDLPPKAAEQLGRPLTDFDWYAFTAIATVANS